MSLSMLMNSLSIESLNTFLLRQIDGQTLMSFCRNHFDAKCEHVSILSCRHLFIMIIYRNHQPNRSHASDFHGSCGPMLKELKKASMEIGKQLSYREYTVESK